MGGKSKSQFIKETKTIYKTSDTITIPLEVFETAESKEEIEDWLLAHDSEFIKKMLKARKEDIDGKDIPWEQVRKRLDIK